MSAYLAPFAVAVVEAAIAVLFLGWALRRTLIFSMGLFLVIVGLHTALAAAAIVGARGVGFTVHGPWAYVEAIATALLGVALVAGAARLTPHRE